MKFKSDIKTKEIENLCNVFASELLLPSYVLLSRIGIKRHDISLAELSDIQKQYGISIDVIMEAMRRLDVIRGGFTEYCRCKIGRIDAAQCSSSEV